MLVLIMYTTLHLREQSPFAWIIWGLLLALMGIGILTEVLFYQWHINPLKKLRAAFVRLVHSEDQEAVPEDANADLLEIGGLIQKECERIQNQLEYSEQRYRLMAKLSNDVIFEFDLKNDTICDSNDWNILASGKQFVQGTIDQKVVHPEEADLFYDFFRGPQTVGELKEVQLRLYSRICDAYEWTQIRGIVLGDREGKPEKILGRRLNIDKLKKESEGLREMAQRDSTGLYNKLTAETRIRQILAGEPEQSCVLLLIDIDHFKKVNDTLGHQVGDEVIQEIAQKLDALFREDDIIGRFGGDEYIVLLKGRPVFPRDGICNCCNRIINVFHNAEVGKKYGYSLSCSIGVALYPEDGTDFETLFQMVDQALYTAKRLGRDRFAFYQEDTAKQ
ncbi:GGDEF domain-containing protein [Clostridium sp. D33t1_170424_F3]|uniref:sensor domain-containing diguanylate cyclase n=1 Tax=Clostridium sp. D33t1_170424_F3 TaxID=2787099 RepID=UPI0018AC19E6|nr:GGDEF domain-containing protein [Clostridium sp. D33t1_170424_F3]